MNNIEEIATLDNAGLDLTYGYGKRVVDLHAIAQVPRENEIDSDELLKRSLDAINAINPQDHLQLMLASQITSVHNYQQKMLYYAINMNQPDIIVKFANLAIKLSNVFVQQVHLMKALQGGAEKKVIFEHVHVHSGAQAVVGTVHTSTTLQQE